LYSVGSSGYGNGATSLASTSSDSNGSFSFVNFNSCPSGNPGVQTYMVAVGGNAGAGSNSAIGLMALTGPCNRLSPSTYVAVNALTTMAAQWALAQFGDSTGTNFGTSSSNVRGLQNAVNQSMNNLVVSLGTGASDAGIPSRFLPWASGSAVCTSAQNCDGLKRLDTMANIVNSCINTSGPSSTQCSTLLSDAGGGATTLAAAHYIVTNPTSNVAAIYAITPPAGMTLFTPRLSSAPNDWTLALNFEPASLNEPYAAALDSSGDVWVANYAGNSVTELPAGNYVTGTTVYDNTNSPGAAFDVPTFMTLDGSNDVWVVNYSGNSVTELPAGNYAAGATVYNNTNSPGAAFSAPFSLGLDSVGNVWVANGGSSVSELPAANYSAGATNYDPAGAAFFEPFSIAPDSGGNIWIANGAGNSVSELPYLNYNSGAANYSPAAASFEFPAAILLDNSSNVWVANCGAASGCSGTGTGSISELEAGAYGTAAVNYNPAGATLIYPKGLAMDSGGNLWAVNYCSNSACTGNNVGSVSELTFASGYSTGLNFAPPGASFYFSQSLALDGSGNVWITNSAGYSVSELIGLANPVLTPPQSCLQSGHNVCLP